MGGRPSQVLVVLANSGTTTHPLPTSGRVTIGRSRDNDVCIDDRSISRHHAILHVGPVMRIEDLGSANGTRVRDLTEPTSSVAGGSATEPYRDVEVPPGTLVEIEHGRVVQVGSVLVATRPGDTASAATSEAIADRPERMVVRDPRIEELARLADHAAAGTISVLLLGETGVGKEVFAERIVRRSPRATRPFVRLNCSALSESLLESELFGHERGAFTGATHTKPGLLEAADSGTVFLDEVGELPLPLQAKLLRVVEEGSVLRVGSTKPRTVDVRYIAATNRDLPQEVARGAFRQDLYFRLNGVTLVIPPLRERPAEIEPLARAALAELSLRAGRGAPPDVHPEARSLLETYGWPGNIRELRSMMERALLLCGDGPVCPIHLPLDRMTGAPTSARGDGSSPSTPVPSQPSSANTSTMETIPPPASTTEDDLRLRLGQLERERIVQALERCGGNQTRAAAMLGISRGTLVSRIASYGLPRPKKGGG